MNSKENQIQSLCFNLVTISFSINNENYSATFYDLKKNLVWLQDKVCFSKNQKKLALRLQEIGKFFYHFFELFKPLSFYAKPIYTNDTPNSLFVTVLLALEKANLYTRVVSQSFHIILVEYPPLFNMFSTSFPQKKLSSFVLEQKRCT